MSRNNIDITQFQMDPEKPLPVDTPSEVIGYGLGGTMVDPAGPGCLAKVINNTHHYLRFRSDGLRSGKLFDPRADNPADLDLPARATGKPRYEFRKVNQTAFGLYIAFLREGLTSLLNNAERSIINGI